jgi:hypothetical protein
LLFLNTALVIGSLAIAIPIIIHLLNRRSKKIVDWGAMNFLFESLAIRNRRIQLEEALLMATRCLLVGLLALALARPFIPPGTTIPWIAILPLMLLGVVGLGVAVVLHGEKKWQRWIGGISILLLLSCIGLIAFEKYLNLSRFTPGARQDVALIIDGSTSMSIMTDGETNFERAVEEARTLITRAPRGHAFSLILGGPSPTAIVLDPTTDRAALDLALDDLAPIDGSMATFQAFTLASLSLARGDNPAKQVVILTDEQDIGWEIGKAGEWSFLQDTFKSLSTEPQILIRKLPLPDYIRNLAVTDMALSRDIVGVDRPVEISVTIRNTGNEAVTPASLILSVGGNQSYRDQSIAQLQPGERQTVTFSHQFSTSGAHSVSAQLEIDDDIATDNFGYYATNVADRLKVMIVDGRPSGRALERASTFAVVALAPSSLTLDPSLKSNNEAVADEASDNFDMFYDPTLDLIDFLIEPTVVDAPDIRTLSEFETYDAVILVDVPRLPQQTAKALSSYVESGGGLLVAAGNKSQADFYNQWKLGDGLPVLPALLANQPSFASDGDYYQPSSGSLTHPALRKVAEPGKSDFLDTFITSYRGQEIPDSLSRISSVGARLNNGAILLSDRKLGDGKVVLTSIPLDLSSGNLVTRQAFLPYLHELVYYLANPAAYELNLEPGWEININLAGQRGRAIGQGLTAKYYLDHFDQEPFLVRTDNSINFDWKSSTPAVGIPVDKFRVEWEGSIQFPETNRYTFISELDGKLSVTINNNPIGDFKSPGSRKQSGFKFEADKWYEFRANYHEESGNAKVSLMWESDSMARQIIPSRALRTFSQQENEAGRQSSLTTYQVNGPGGRPRTAQLASVGSGSVLKLQGEISSGLYHLIVPEEQRLYFSQFLSQEGKEIPFTVRRNENESRLEKLSEADYTFIGKFVTLAQPQTLEELVGFLNGNQFGQELWRYLAMGALIFLLIEVTLSRWISLSRRMGEDIAIQFESKDAPSGKFHEQLLKMGKKS